MVVPVSKVECIGGAIIEYTMLDPVRCPAGQHAEAAARRAVLRLARLLRAGGQVPPPAAGALAGQAGPDESEKQKQKEKHGNELEDEQSVTAAR